MINWVLLIIVIVAAVIIFKILKSVIKTIVIISFIFLLISGIVFIFMVKDMNEFKERFPQAKKLFILVDGSQVVGATSIAEFSFGPEDSLMGYLPTEIAALDAQFQSKDFEGIKGDHYIVFFLTRELLEDGLPEEVPFGEHEYAKQSFIDALFSITPSDLLVSADGDTDPEIVRQNLLIENTEEDIRAFLMMSAFSQVSDEQGTIYMVQQMKVEHLIIYPDYLVFSIARKTPRFILSLMVKD